MPNLSSKKDKDGRELEDFDVAIIGAGISGISAAMKAKKAGLKYVIGDPGFWYSLAYCCTMVYFGILGSPFTIISRDGFGAAWGKAETLS